MRVRKSVQGDAAAIASIFRGGMDAAILPYTILNGHGYAEYVRHQISAEKFSGDHCYWVACDGDEVVGASEFRHSSSTWFLNNIHVRADWRGRGVGRQLIQTGVLFGVDCGYQVVSLDVFHNNIRVRDWYKTIGMKESYRTSYSVSSMPVVSNQHNVYVSGLAQARILLDSFGFASISVYGAHEYGVGMLGDNMFRLSTTRILDDPAALLGLKRVDPARSLLFVIPEEEASHRSGLVLVRSMRMEGAINVVAKLINVR